MELLDGELWLLPAQRQALRPLVAQSLAGTKISSANAYAPEVVWLAHPLTEIRSEDLHGVLSEAQCNLWQLMSQYFRLIDDGRSCLIYMGTRGQVTVVLNGE